MFHSAFGSVLGAFRVIWGAFRMGLGCVCGERQTLRPKLLNIDSLGSRFFDFQ